jgi:FMN-dependent oxidoreductase (nitrilotriacetate monooxygenase family)
LLSRSSLNGGARGPVTLRTVPRQMILTGFLQAQNCTNLPASWRHPASRTDFLTANYYREIASVLERGKFHLAFFDDRLAMPDRYGNDHAHTVEHGIRCVKLDPIVVLMTMGMATQRLGLGATCSTTYYEPFHVARLFATIDLMTDGRAAWNVVTSLNDGEALNMGRAEVMEHDLRYDRADEFMTVVLGHWDSWEDDALIVDKDSGRFADGSKVHRLDHQGEFFRSRGPFTVPRSAQGHPVVIQAGQSGRGRRFAGRWGEVIFATAPNVAFGKRSYADLKEEAASAGRDPDSMVICNLVTPVCAETKTAAEDKMAIIQQLPLEIDQLSLLAEALNFDFAVKGLDEPLTAEELASFSGLHTIRDRVLSLSGKANPTVREFMELSHRGRADDAIVGGPKEVADALEAMFEERGCDGFVVAATYVPGGYADFVDYVIPELQHRGLYHLDYEGSTLRENLGLPRPERGAWKTYSPSVAVRP